jgi:hypothetical protein
MKNINYMPEIASAHQFIINHSYDGDLRTFIYEMQHNATDWSHSDRWGAIYDWMQEHYPEATGSLITGLCYYCES